MKKYPGQVEIAFEYLRHHGPRMAHGGVRLQFDSIQPFSFTSKASWPSEVNYESVIQSEVEHVLLERIGNLEKVSVVLKEIFFDPINSSEEGFRRAARSATEAAFSV